MEVGKNMKDVLSAIAAKFSFFIYININFIDLMNEI
jgi:hypothetical protein